MNCVLKLPTNCSWACVMLSGLLKDSLRKYWLEQVRGMEAAKTKSHNKTPRELTDMDTVCVHTTHSLMIAS